jgi:hypothetical protein
MEICAQKVPSPDGVLVVELIKNGWKYQLLCGTEIIHTTLYRSDGGFAGAVQLVLLRPIKPKTTGFSAEVRVSQKTLLMRLCLSLIVVSISGEYVGNPVRRQNSGSTELHPFNNVTDLRASC